MALAILQNSTKTEGTQTEYLHQSLEILRKLSKSIMCNRKITVALIFALVTCCQIVTASSSGQDNDDASYEDNFTEAAKVVFAELTSKPVGFEATREALQSMQNELDEADKKFGRLDEQLEQLKKDVRVLLYTSKPAQGDDNCAIIFDMLDMIEGKFESNNVNLTPYLAQCRAIQLNSCGGNSQPAAGQFEAAPEVAVSEKAKTRKSKVMKKMWNPLKALKTCTGCYKPKVIE